MVPITFEGESHPNRAEERLPPLSVEDRTGHCSQSTWEKQDEPIDDGLPSETGLLVSLQLVSKTKSGPGIDIFGSKQV